jgi:hypothetical protein
LDDLWTGIVYTVSHCDIRMNFRMVKLIFLAKTIFGTLRKWCPRLHWLLLCSFVTDIADTLSLILLRYQKPYNCFVLKNSPKSITVPCKEDAVWRKIFSVNKFLAWIKRIPWISVESVFLTRLGSRGIFWIFNFLLSKDVSFFTHYYSHNVDSEKSKFKVRS